jgi:hypothetical protein
MENLLVIQDMFYYITTGSNRCCQFTGESSGDAAYIERERSEIYATTVA